MHPGKKRNIPGKTRKTGVKLAKARFFLFFLCFSSIRTPPGNDGNTPGADFLLFAYNRKEHRKSPPGRGVFRVPGRVGCFPGFPGFFGVFPGIPGYPGEGGRNTPGTPPGAGGSRTPTRGKIRHPELNCPGTGAEGVGQYCPGGWQSIPAGG